MLLPCAGTKHVAAAQAIRHQSSSLLVCRNYFCSQNCDLFVYAVSTFIGRPRQKQKRASSVSTFNVEVGNQLEQMSTAAVALLSLLQHMTVPLNANSLPGSNQKATKQSCPVPDTEAVSPDSAAKTIVGSSPRAAAALAAGKVPLPCGGTHSKVASVNNAKCAPSAAAADVSAVSSTSASFPMSSGASDTQTDLVDNDDSCQRDSCC